MNIQSERNGQTQAPRIDFDGLSSSHQEEEFPKRDKTLHALPANNHLNISNWKSHEKPERRGPVVTD